MCFSKKKKKVGITNSNSVEDADEVMVLQQKMYQDVFDVLQSYLPEGWKKVAVYDLEIENMSEVKFYVDSGKGYIDCFDLYDSQKISKFIEEVSSITKPVKNALPKKHKWYVFKMFVTSEGDMNVEYEYKNILGKTIDYGTDFEKSLKVK